jgi:septal ring factor EnvC (AmiA/AmiB activator)
MPARDARHWRCIVPALAGSLACGAILIASVPAPAEQKRDLKAVERDIESSKRKGAALDAKAKSLQHRLNEIRQLMVRAAAAVQDSEARLSRLERSVVQLRAKRAALSALFNAKRKQTMASLAALQRLAIYPPEAVLFSPNGPDGTVRGALVLRDTLPELRRRAASIRAQIEELRALSASIERKQARLEATRTELKARQDRLAALLGESARLYKLTQAEQERNAARLKLLTAQARNLRELLAKIKRKPIARTARLPRPGGLRDFSRARGHVAMPARGRIVSRFGAANGNSLFTRGIVLETRAGAQVVAPFDGRVVFAGPFRDYGALLIIEHGEGYHTLLAGMARIDVAVNQWLLGGEPVGAMSTTQSHPNKLYMEIRQKGQPINPLPWLAATAGKVNG